MPTDAARNAADIAADHLRRLAEDLEAAAGVDLSGAPRLRAAVERTLADDRNEAAGALERLGAALPDSPHPGEGGEDSPQVRAWSQKALVMHNATADECRRWEAAWRAFSSA